MKLEKNLLSIFLSLSYLSAVADRFGLWGDAGTNGVVWGDYEKFLAYTKFLNSWAFDWMIPFLGGVATVLEIILPIFLIFNYKRSEAALVSAILLGLFAFAMIVSGGIKGVFDYSVLTAMSASLLLFRVEKRAQ
jgi:hypothetical protein